MIKRIEISGLHYKLAPDIKDYAHEKIGKLDHYINQHARISIHAEVKLKGSQYKNKHQNLCEVILHMPQEIIRVEESATTMPAAIDLAQARLKNRLKKYKEKYRRSRGRRFLRRLARQIRSTQS